MGEKNQCFKHLRVNSQSQVDSKMRILTDFWVRAHKLVKMHNNNILSFFLSFFLSFYPFSRLLSFFFLSYFTFCKVFLSYAFPYLFYFFCSEWLAEKVSHSLVEIFLPTFSATFRHTLNGIADTALPLLPPQKSTLSHTHTRTHTHTHTLSLTHTLFLSHIL